MSTKNTKKVKTLPAAAAGAPTPAAVSKLQAIPKKAKAGAEGSDANPRPISHAEVRRDKKRERSLSVGRVSNLEKKSRSDLRPRSGTLGKAEYDPLSLAQPLGAAKIPEHLIKSPHRDVAPPPSPTTSVSSVTTDDDVTLVGDDESEDDLTGVKNALADMGVTSRQEGFEKALAEGDDLACLFATSEEEMGRAREMLEKVCPELFLSPLVLQFIRLS